jgi:hypothetical protein
MSLPGDLCMVVKTTRLRPHLNLKTRDFPNQEYSDFLLKNETVLLITTIESLRKNEGFDKALVLTTAGKAGWIWLDHLAAIT